MCLFIRESLIDKSASESFYSVRFIKLGSKIQKRVVSSTLYYRISFHLMIDLLV